MATPGTLAALPALVLASAFLAADPCGMVPPIDIAGVTPIERIGLQKTYAFYRDGIETFVIRPGYRGRVDHFGMLIPFPAPPAIRKAPDEIFAHIAAAVDPPEVVVNLFPAKDLAAAAPASGARYALREKALGFDDVRVLRQEAVGMYEVVVLAAGSAQALQRWMDEHGYVYPRGMDQACQDYVDIGWCFVAVKTRVGNKAGVDPKPGQREVDPQLPSGATFDGNVQAMAFRFRTDRFVVPMRLSAFNAGELRNVVYILTDGPRRIDSIPEKFVVRQVSGEDLYRNLTAPLPLRVLGGDFDDIPLARKARLASERDPAPHNGLARELFASDLLSAMTGKLSHAFEEREKELLRISERLDLRGAEIDRLHAQALEAERDRTLAGALEALKDMTLTVIDGDFPRDVLGRENLTFSLYEMDGEKNASRAYDAKLFGPAPERQGTLYRAGAGGVAGPALGIGAAILLSLAAWRLLRRVRYARSGAAVFALVALPATARSADDLFAQLIDRLGDAERSARAADALVALGSEAVGPLFDVAIDGTDLARRGWAIASLAEIGGPEVDRRLIAIIEDSRQPELVRAWAAAARVKVAPAIEDLVSRADLLVRYPALGRPIGKRLVALLGEGTVATPAQLIQLGIRVPELVPALGPTIIESPPPELAELMISAPDQEVRRQAAGYLAAAAQQEVSGVAEAVVAVSRFEPDRTEVPWHGGPLFIPAIPWPQDSARELAASLIEWYVFCDQNQLEAEKRQIHNNLRSLELARAAGYRSPGWRNADIEAWLKVWRDAFGAESVRKILERQGVAEEPKYQAFLEPK